MLIAEVRRKLLDLEDVDPDSPGALDHVRALLKSSKEDILTADVFGAIKYLPRRPFFGAMLDAIAARNPSAIPFQAAVGDLKSSSTSMKAEFWPTYPTPEGLEGVITEPDLVFSNEHCFLMFECKLYAGFGAQQIERELAICLEQAGKRETFLVLVTPGIRPPRMRIHGKRLPFPEFLAQAVSSGEIPKALGSQLLANADRVVWISWSRILASLTTALSSRILESFSDDVRDRVVDILTDLEELMSMRGIHTFGGFMPSMDFTPLPRDGSPIFFGLSRETQLRVGEGGFSFSRAVARPALKFEFHVAQHSSYGIIGKVWQRDTLQYQEGRPLWSYGNLGRGKLFARSLSNFSATPNDFTPLWHRQGISND
jgi:hypothetical protein